jgi:hypothetical protein
MRECEEKSRTIHPAAASDQDRIATTTASADPVRIVDDASVWPSPH